MNLPEGYTEHDGALCPVEPDSYVDLIIRTSEGLGHSGVMRASLHDWAHDSHDQGIGAVLAYRPAKRGEKVDLVARWPEVE